MPGAERAEIYFIAAMMLLILFLCFAAVYFFEKLFKKDMRDIFVRFES
jgi:flagellar biogenesis protein FliO